MLINFNFIFLKREGGKKKNSIKQILEHKAPFREGKKEKTIKQILEHKAPLILFITLTVYSAMLFFQLLNLR